jgi:ubiquinone/menaquinone biosynthesis C-methylase UbiE
VEFWRDYLDHFHYIVNFPDYWHLLDRVYSMAGILGGGERILDAGCGNGNFGMFFLINQAYRQRNTEAKLITPQYVGIDFVPKALSQTRLNLAKVRAEICRQSPNVSVPQLTLSRADLNSPLPFQDEQFDRVICNLVIGYLQNPLSTLRELIRVLSPNGKIVITNLKPQADLSQIYRNFVQASRRQEEVQEARALLSNSGKIKQGESDGSFIFYDKEELASLLKCSGAIRPRIYSTFSNQAYIVVAEKPARLNVPRMHGHMSYSTT